MSVPLSKGGNVSLNKEAPGRTTITVGLGWDVRPAGGPDYNLDASALLCGESGKVLSDEHLVFCNNLRSPDGSVTHSGGKPTDGGHRDNEQMHIDLANVPPVVQK